MSFYVFHICLRLCKLRFLFQKRDPAKKMNPMRIIRKQRCINGHIAPGCAANVFPGHLYDVADFH